MSRYVLSLNPGGLDLYPHKIHNPSAILFEDTNLLFGVEEERFSRDKHGSFSFPESSIDACLDAHDLDLSDVDPTVLSWDMALQSKLLEYELKKAITRPNPLVSKSDARLRNTLFRSIRHYCRSKPAHGSQCLHPTDRNGYSPHLPGSECFYSGRFIEC